MSGAFSEEFERALSQVWQLAQNRGHGYVTLEHIVLAVLNESSTQGLFREHEIPLSVFQDELLEFIERHTPVAARPRRKSRRRAASAACRRARR